MSDYLPPGTSDRDHDAPWNAEDDDGADEAHGVEQVTGGDTEYTVDTFTNFVAGITDEEQALKTTSTWLRIKLSNADLLKIILSGENKSVLFAAATELRARYLADPFTKRVIENAASDWRAEARV